MMKKHAVITGITLAVAIGIAAITIPRQPDTLDLSSATASNPPGIAAKVIMEKDLYVSRIRQCNITATPHLILTSKVDSKFVSYEICNNASCKSDV